MGKVMLRLGSFKRRIEKSVFTMQCGMGTRDALKKLKHTGSVCEYVEELSSLLLHCWISRTCQKRSCSTFISGLQLWVQDLSGAMAVANKLLDCVYPIIMGQLDKRLAKRNEKNALTKTDMAKAMVPNNERKYGCFICQDPHNVCDCPKKEKLNALWVDEVKAKEKRQKGR